MGVDMGGIAETERKYEVGADFALPDLSRPAAVSTVTVPRTHRLSAIYFDTPDFRLASVHITLRRRTGGADAGWHLKLPVGGDTRREVHAPLGTRPSTVPEELASQVSGWTGGQALSPVARLQTTRDERRLADAGGRVLAEVVDDNVTGSMPAAGEWTVVSTWREVEVELKLGTVAVLDAVEDLLVQAGARPSRAASKLGRLLTAAGVTPPESGGGDVTDR
jgi:inorganic triphosphatase YgiF